MTFATHATGRNKKIALWFTIQGIERVFKERRGIDCSTLLGEARTESTVVMRKGLDEGEETLDLQKLCAVGGSFKASLVQPFGSTVLRDTFKTLERKKATLTTDMTKTATSASVVSTAALGSVGTDVDVFIGGETIGAHINSATALTSLVRGKYGSRAQTHKGVSGGDVAGAVFLAAPAWLGRRVTLYGSWLLDDGTTTAALTTTLGTYVIEKPPTSRENVWTIECGPLSDEYAARKLYVGQSESKGGSLYLENVTDEDYTVEIDDATKFVVGANYQSWALIKIAGDPSAPYPKRFARYQFSQVTSANGATTPNTITVRPVNWYDPPITFSEVANASSGGSGGIPVESVRHVGIIGGITGTPLLNAIMSMLGDGANGAYDVMPGRDRSALLQPSWRFGAGVHEADVDAAAFDALSRSWFYVLDEETTLGAILGQWCLLADRFWLTTAAGLLSSKSASDVATTATMTISAAMRVPGSPVETWVDEASIFPTVKVDANWSPGAREFRFSDTTNDYEMLDRYPQREDIREVQAKGLGVDIGARLDEWPQHFVRPNLMTIGELETTARRWQVAEGRGRLMVKVVCTMLAVTLAVGDVVTIGFDGDNYTGGSINGRRARVVGRRRRWADGAVDLTLAVMETVYVFAPSAVVTAVTTTTIANDTVTLSTTSHDVSGTSPENDFPVGTQVRLWDMTPAISSQVLTVAAILAGHKLRFTAGVVGTVETGRDWLTWNTLATNAALTSSSGFSETGGAYMCADNEANADGTTRRWR